METPRPSREDALYVVVLFFCMSGMIPAGLLFLFVAGVVTIDVLFIAAALVPITLGAGCLSLYLYARAPL